MLLSFPTLLLESKICIGNICQNCMGIIFLMQYEYYKKVELQTNSLQQSRVGMVTVMNWRLKIELKTLF